VQGYSQVPMQGYRMTAKGLDAIQEDGAIEGGQAQDAYQANSR
jgi:hypothetical protein